MGNLIKPAEYAKKLGISRQAVYAKIKKGVLTSKNVDGKLYIVQEGSTLNTSKTGEVDNAAGKGVNRRANTTRPNRGIEDLLAAKDETIGILKNTINDLKETNQMITSTLRSEVDLLKEAFSEMKMLYSTQIEHLQIEEHIKTGTDEPEEEFDIAVDMSPAQEEDGDELAWIELEDFFDEHDIRKQAKQKKFTKKIHKLLKKGDSRVDSYNGDLIVLADADFSDVIKKIKKS